MSDKSYLLGKDGAKEDKAPSSPPPEGTTSPLYHDSTLSPRAKILQIAFIALVTVMVLIALSLSIYRCVAAGEALYILLGLSLLGFVLIQGILVFFVRSGDLAKGKTWFFYFTGLCTILEAIFTCILVFN